MNRKNLIYILIFVGMDLIMLGMVIEFTRITDEGIELKETVEKQKKEIITLKEQNQNLWEFYYYVTDKYGGENNIYG